MLQRFVVGWLPSLLLNLWQSMILPLTMYLLNQVCVCGGGGRE